MLCQAEAHLPRFRLPGCRWKPSAVKDRVSIHRETQGEAHTSTSSPGGLWAAELGRLNVSETCGQNRTGAGRERVKPPASPRES